MGALSKIGSFVFVGAVSWVSGFFSSDSGAWWIIAGVLIALLIAAYFFFGK